jgi:superfamily II DNA/RNA helicase
MFDMGFLPDIKRILECILQPRQTLLFSATMPDDIRRLVKEVLQKSGNDPDWTYRAGGIGITCIVSCAAKSENGAVTGTFIPDKNGFRAGFCAHQTSC